MIKHLVIIYFIILLISETVISQNNFFLSRSDLSELASRSMLCYDDKIRIKNINIEKLIKKKKREEHELQSNVDHLSKKMDSLDIVILDLEKIIKSHQKRHDTLELITHINSKKIISKKIKEYKTLSIEHQKEISSLKEKFFIVREKIINQQSEIEEIIQENRKIRIDEAEELIGNDCPDALALINLLREEKKDFLIQNTSQKKWFDKIKQWLPNSSEDIMDVFFFGYKNPFYQVEPIGAKDPLIDKNKGFYYYIDLLDPSFAQEKNLVRKNLQGDIINDTTNTYIEIRSTSGKQNVSDVISYYNYAINNSITIINNDGSYIVDTSQGRVKKLLLFKQGEYIINNEQFLNKFNSSMIQFCRDVISILIKENRDYEIYIIGSADKLGNNDFRGTLSLIDHDKYKTITLFDNKSGFQFKYKPNTYTTPNPFFNKDLPNLRARHIEIVFNNRVFERQFRRTTGESLDGKIHILNGRVSSEIAAKDRSARLILYISNP